MTSWVWITDPNTFRFFNESNYVWIVYFHFDQSFLCRQPFIVCGIGLILSFLMMSMVTRKKLCYP